MPIVIPAPVVVHNDVIQAVQQRDWVMLKETIDFLSKVGIPHSMTTVLHWMIQSKEIPLIDIVHVIDVCLDVPICSLFPTSITLLQRAIVANRIDVMQALIERCHSLFHDFNIPVVFHPMILAFHPAVEEDTFIALLSYYVLPNPAFLSYWVVQDRLTFYVPLSHSRMTLLIQSGANAKLSFFDHLCADSSAMILTSPTLLSKETVVELLFHYITQKNENVAVYLIGQFMQPFRMPSLASAVLRSNFKLLVQSAIPILYLGEPVVAEGKSAMLIAAEANADNSCRALMDAKIDGDVEGASSWLLQINKPNTAYRAAVERNGGLATELLAYNARKAEVVSSVKIN